VRVLDACVLVEIFFQTPPGIRHTDRVLDRNVSLHVPHLLDLEILQAIGWLTLAGEISAGRAEAALIALLDLELARHEHIPFIGRIWELRASMTAFDAPEGSAQSREIAPIVGSGPAPFSFIAYLRAIRGRVRKLEC
jgi:predicted nucleic acid-binding protein